MGNKNSSGIFQAPRIPEMAINKDTCSPHPLDLKPVHLYPVLEDRSEGREKQEPDLLRGSPSFMFGLRRGEQRLVVARKLCRGRQGMHILPSSNVIWWTRIEMERRVPSSPGS